MGKRTVLVTATAFGAVLVGLALRATTLHSVIAEPLIYRVLTHVNDLDKVEGIAPPGRLVELWVKQRNFKEGDDQGDPFAWCEWKNNGQPVRLGHTFADAAGVFRFTGLRTSGTTVMMFPAAPAGDRCRGGIYTELLPRTCDAPGVNCTGWALPRLHWMNVKKLTARLGAVAGSVSGAEQTAAAVADGPDDGDTPSDLVDVDQNGIDTGAEGFVIGQRVTWRCGGGGTVGCPSVTIHDPSTAIETDPEYPFVLGTIQAHRTGGSFVAAASVPRGTPIGFAVNVNVRLRGSVDINLGCDTKSPFDFF